MYRKLSASHIFDGYRLLPANQVLITNTNGVVIDLIDKQEAGDDIEFHEGILSPGFINAHCHLELSHLKDVIPTHTGLVSFVQQVMTKRFSSDEAKTEAMYKAEQEMYNSGIVAVGDICNTADSIPVKEKSKIQWHNFIEVSGFVNSFAEKRFVDAKNVLRQFLTLNSQLSTLGPHAPYSVSKTLFELINKETANQLITIHNQESEAENELYKTKSGNFLELYQNFGIDIAGFKATGKTSLQTYLPYFTNHQSIILVHNTFINDADIQFSTLNAQLSTYFCLCPNANKYIESANPPIQLLRKNKCNIVLGTDSLASNHQLNIMEEIKIIQQIDSSIPIEELIQWATINGAKALQMDKELGSFEKGKRPGIVLIDHVSDLKISPESVSERII